MLFLYSSLVLGQAQTTKSFVDTAGLALRLFISAQFLSIKPRKGLKRYPFARFGLSGKRYKRKARSGACAGCAQIPKQIYRFNRA
jgi:hypothetical protein